MDEIQTLEKGAQMADLLPVVSLCEALQKAYQRVIDEKLTSEDEIVPLLEEGHEGLLNMMDMVAASQAILPANELIAQLTGEPYVAPEKPNLKQDSLEDSPEEKIELELPVVEIDESELENTVRIGY